jgi:hypothetical protein
MTSNLLQLSIKYLFYVISIVALFACSQKISVEEHFHNHGLTYPVDSSGISMRSIDFVGIDEGELSAPGAREYVQKGIAYAKEYFNWNKIHNYIPGADGVVMSQPVLFRDESGDVGLMVKVTAFGLGKPYEQTKGKINWLGSDKTLWSLDNFVYFIRRDFLNWEYKGWVY